MSSDETAAGLPPAAQAAINISLGGVVVSNYLSFLTMGIVLCTAWIYFSKFPRDRWSFKALVAFCVSMCIADTVGTGIWTYDWGVAGYANPSVMAVTHWAFPLEAFMLGTCSLCVQTFYAWRVWMVSMKKNWILPVVIVCSSIMAWCVVCWMVHILATHKFVADLTLVLPVVYIWLGGSVAADVMITAAMIYYLDLRFRMKLQKHLVPFVGSSHSRFRQIIFRTIECNVLSLFAQAVTVALFNRSSVGFYFVITDMTLAKIYTFSLLVSLNGRHSNGRENTGIGSSSKGESHALAALGDRRGAHPSNYQNGTQVSVQIQRHTDTASEWAPSEGFKDYNTQKLRLGEV
ncbi:hypothetical protein C8J56DRAFT_1045521 [Mycena floridula]|nr:hypothetical protein C8J56DRAFT_1045521 [Mycena floridula]